MTVALIEALTKLLSCSAVDLQEQLNHPNAINKVEQFLKGKTLRTSYLNRNDEKKDVCFSSLSLKAAQNLHAYEGYLGVTVRQHFYCVYRIKLLYPNMKCITVVGSSGHKKHYPIELLELQADGTAVEADGNYLVDAYKASWAEPAPKWFNPW